MIIYQILGTTVVLSFTTMIAGLLFHQIDVFSYKVISRLVYGGLAGAILSGASLLLTIIWSS